MNGRAWAGALFERSLETIRDNQAHSGAYPASPDFSQYGYVWLRDGSFTAYAMDRVGDHESAERFLRFTATVIRRYRSKIESVVRKSATGAPIGEDEYCHTRFTLNGEETSTDWWNHQLDGYGTWLWALARHIELTGGNKLPLEYAESVQLTLDYLRALWRQPNYDCWEENRDRIHPATLACVYGGVQSIGTLTSDAAALGLAEKIRAFVRSDAAPDGHLVKFLGSTAVDASLLWAAVPFGLLSLDDPIMRRTIARVEDDLRHGGVHRYLDDTYYGGGEWVLLTAWLGWVHALTGDRQKAVTCRDWVEAQASATGELPEQVAEHALFPDMVRPWVDRWGRSAKVLLWSHAMYVLLCVELAESAPARRQATRSEAVWIEHWPHPREGVYPSSWPERYPDRPEAAQEVRLRVHTGPADSVARVWVDWRHADAAGESQASWEYVADGVDVWLIRVPGALAGTRVMYTVHADGVTAGPFNYDVADWRIGFTEDRFEPLELEELTYDVGADGEPCRVRWRFKSPDDEAFYGLGERFNSLDQRGNRLDIHVYEQYKRQGVRTYMPVPFLLSSRGYGVVLHSSRYAAFDLAATEPTSWSMTLEAPDTSFTVLRGKTPADILQQYADFVGHASVPPEWAFGPWMSSNDWNNQARVEREVAATHALDIPATVLVLEAWSDESTFYIWNDARYQPGAGDWRPRLADFAFAGDARWPDPKRMIEDLHARGMRLLLWQVPVYKQADGTHAQQSADECHMLEQRFMVKEADGSAYRHRGWWFPGSLVLDVTNPAAVDWWLAKRAYLLDEMHIDGFKTDGGEHIWGRELRFTDGSSGAETCNRFPALYTSAYYRFAREHRGEAVTFSRAGFAGSQASPCHWAGDEDSTWAAFRHSILAGLNAGMSGITFWGFDLAGFSGEIPSAELYLRATAVAAVSPIMQYHSEYRAAEMPNRDRTPWNIAERTGDSRVIDVYRQFAQLRIRMLPYICAQARRSSELGLPLMRALPVAFPDQSETTRAFPYEYLFGDDLLVCPVVRPGVSEWEVYIPPGDWRDAWSGAPVSGDQRFMYAAPFERPPVFTRGSVTLPVFDTRL